MPHAHHRDLALRHTHARREVVPAARLPLLVPSDAVHVASAPSLAARAESTSTCDNGGNCTKPTSNLTTTVLPVVLGAGVPIICAIVVLIFLHRRHTKRLMREDADDKHKSLDFGMDLDPVSGGRKRPGQPGPNGMPQMMEPSHTKGGMSIDIMDPYLLPPGLHGSSDSLHSMSRSIDDDKYRRAFGGSQYDSRSVRSQARPPRDDASSFAGSTSRFGASEEPKSALLQNAQRMSRSSPPPPLYKSPSNDSMAQGNGQSPQNHLGPAPGLHPAPSEHDERGLSMGDHNKSHDQAPPYPDNNLSSLNFDIEPHNTHEDRPNFPLPETTPQHDPAHAQTSNTQLPRISLPSSDVTSDYGDDRHERRSSLMIPAVNVHASEEQTPETSGKDNKLPELPEEPPQNLDAAYDTRRDTRRLTLGVRPLPPEDPADNPEQRANRIRSFYKEYFDDSKRETTYYEDYGPEFYDDGGYVYDPTTGDYYDTTAPPPMPFAEPMGRRAMTPPPRAPPRFQGAARHMATNSAGFSGYGTPPPPRAFSSASGAFGGGPRGPRRPMPPPAPLQVLPTPHMLKDDSAIFLANEFAPARNFRDQASGRPETPTGGSRPYSPGMRAHTPLASAFDDLAVIPSPHMLRKSGTFTSLDFAPPPRFKNEGGPASDSGSIRSNRTGISNVHMNNVRMGNYRVSRLPADMVGTKDDLMTSLKPDWDMKR